ncbi:related to interferon-induced GTP-binding protein Mx2 [Phialocephala subalpina]|uniref:Related to interferon-induced GTP-binding protein Mx2 n=1 Tax=Phialocephala subalpina TaxID=576137 RepID=A0A1L7WHR5_9HELO|nr:related to interferon-induced GTP-binding protein Mx2 [Phialocephala subalpina]
MAPGRRLLKRESTAAYGGLATPGASIYASTGGSPTPKSSVSPKREREIESIDLSFSDEYEEEPPAPSNVRSYHGHPADERYSSVADREFRSLSGPSRHPQYHPEPRPSPSRRLTSRSHPSNTRTEMNISPPSQGMEFVGRHVKVLVDAISDLRNFGLDHVVELPELVLVGDQSAGKSSLMSALTEVQLPRDQGICTKCPANIKTSPAEKDWSCKVSLQQYYRYENPNGRVIDSRSVTKRNPFPPWVEQDLEVKEFATLTHKSQLEEAIKWAQIALLNHDVDYQLFIPGVGLRAQGNFQRERDMTEAKFSPNLIAIEISAPGLPALSFYDLPGIFRVAPDPRDQYLSRVIENLAVKYIQRPNALIIWTLAMKTDPSNSSTGKVIQDCKATDRTVGVLTNPDHVYSRHVEYENILQGHAHIVKHGYFVTRQPGENASIPQGDGYHAEARRQEMQFFHSEGLWKGEWREFLPRCGTTAIQKFLSLELAKQIKDSIPSITQKIAYRTEEVDRKLGDCPDLPDSDIKNIIMKILAEFSSDVCNVMDGESTEEFTNQWTTLADHFMSLMHEIKPMIIVNHPSDRLVPEVIEIDDDDDDNESLVAFSEAGKRMNPYGTPVAKKQRVDPTPDPETPTRIVKHEIFDMRGPPSVASSRMGPPCRKPNAFSGTVFEDMADLGRGFISLSGIQTYIKKYVRPGLPGLVSPKTYNFLCTLAIGIWRQPLDAFFNKTISIVRKQLSGILNEHLGLYKQTELFRTAQRQLDEFITGYAEEQRARLEELYELEFYKSFTVNRDAIDKHKEKELEGLMQARRKVRAREWIKKQASIDPKKWRYPAEATQNDKRKLDAKRITEVVKNADIDLGVDPLDLELRVAAYVRGYYVTAADRFVDSVCLSIHGMFFRKIRQNIRFHLEEKLGINDYRDGEDVCRRLMEEDDIIGKRRRALRLEKDKLTGFSARLAKLVAQLEGGQDEALSDVADLEADAEEEPDSPLSSRRISQLDTEMGEGSDDTITLETPSSSYRDGLVAGPEGV